MDAAATPDTMRIPADNLAALEASHARRRDTPRHFPPRGMRDPLSA
ncbi:MULTISPECIES: hypothetical protein [unclassified Rhodanobacter]|nr:MULTISPECIES: hypothetical protein [unclassified Rhodanobacter]